ncbi:Reverse transcriptase (RNA-dependent DNA polymerase) [Nesidiocoris tenuis]|uniref:RNA-directed DNA polymerase n=1 Tax=Nesidiocoris tenuis TaxID=355587 RepID=A0ABN7AIJ9_9HEMI|nr:Reverse transcriptase (RNA-dependent DNA polymerase) [Nesidiocoris tenuis]
MASSNVPLPDKMTMKGNAAENWFFFKMAWDDYLISAFLEKKEERVKVSTLRSLFDRSVMQVLCNLKLTEVQLASCKEIIGALDAYFVPKVNITFERYVFGSTNQGDDEPIDEYVGTLRKLSSTCSYQALEDEMIRDRLVLGIKNESTRKQLLMDSELTLQKAIDICRANELADSQMKRITKAETSENVNKIFRQRQGSFRKPLKGRNNKADRKIPCKYCGNVHKHDRRKCPAYGEKCKLCFRYNHFASVCGSSQNARGKLKRASHVKTLQGSESDEESESSSEAFLIDYVNSADNQKPKRTWVSSLDFIVRKQIIPVDCQLDSGATINVVERDLLLKIFGKSPKLRPSSTTIRCFGGSSVKPLGRIEISVQKNGCKHPLVFEVVESASKPNARSLPILSAETCELLDLVKLKEVKIIQSTASDSKAIIEQYNDVFSGIGCLEGECHLNVSPSFKPIKQTPRRVPVPLREELRQKLEELVSKQIIKKEAGPTHWISNLVIVKSPKKFRVCLDPRPLNQALLRTEYEIPTIESIAPELKDAKIFTVVDTKDGFWNVKLSEESSYLTTFWTPFGRYRWLRLPFGIKVATDEYQRRLHEAFDGLKDIIIVQDDILILGRGVTDEAASANHDEALRKLLDRAREVNIKFNRDKIKLKQKSVKYMGHIVSSEGLKPDPDKIRAINDMRYPRDVQEVKSFMGIVTYMAKFVPNLSAISEPLRVLTKKDTIWTWGEDQCKAVDTIKRLVSQAPVLAYYDPNKQVTLQADASSKGLGAVILQDGRPIAFASRSLAPNEKQWAQIEKECLSILFGCERFAQYLVGGKDIIVQTDHRPLENIFRKSLLSAPVRLQRMMLRLQRYNPTVCYIRGEKMFIADALSRLHLPDQSPVALDEVYSIDSIHQELESLKVSDNINMMQASLQRVKAETANDETLFLLASTIKSGWPSNKEQLPECITPFWDFKDELMIQDGIIYRGNQVVIPKSLRREFIEKIHRCHLGQNASLRRARESLFWPQMSAEIKDRVKRCDVCQKFSISQTQTPMTSHRIPSLPWERLSLDTFKVEADEYAVLVDTYSDFFELRQMKNINSSSIINFLKDNFARHGVPQLLMSDNAPQFVGKEMIKFAKEWEFIHSTSSPFHSQGNGKAESAVKIAKRMIRKCRADGTDIYSALLEWRNTPTTNMDSSPVQRLMSRRTRSSIPSPPQMLVPEVIPSVRELLIDKRRRAKAQYDQHAKELPPLHIGQEVLVKPVATNRQWAEAIIHNSHNDSSYDVEIDGRLYRRNRTWLKPYHRSSPPRRTSFPTRPSSSHQSPKPKSPTQPPAQPSEATSSPTIRSPQPTSSSAANIEKGKENPHADQIKGTKSHSQTGEQGLKARSSSTARSSSSKLDIQHPVKTSRLGREVKPPKRLTFSDPPNTKTYKN